MVASALVTAAGLAYVGRRYFYKKARKWASRNRNKIAAGVATLAMSYRGKRKRSVSRGRSRTRSHVNKKRRVDSVDSGYESYPRLHAKSFVKPRSLSVPVRSKGVQRYRKRYGNEDRRAQGKTIVSAAGGVYGGSMNRGIHRRRSWKEIFNKCGVVCKSESTGTATDDNCVYAVGDVISPSDAISYVVGALLRRLFEKAGLRPAAWDECPITPYTVNAYSDLTVKMIMLNQVTGEFVYHSDAVGISTSFGTVVAYFLTYFQEYVAQFGYSSVGNGLEIVRFELVKSIKDGDDHTNEIQLSAINIAECMLTVYGEATMKVQNRTVSSVGSEDAQNVAANPIQGRAYEFDGLPKFKSYSPVAGGSLPDNLSFNTMDSGNGLKLFGATGATNSVTFKTPPEPGVFWNCTSSGIVKLDPGNVKVLVKKYYKRMNVLKFLQRFGIILILVIILILYFHV